jgi:hypothetical protein
MQVIARRGDLLGSLVPSVFDPEMSPGILLAEMQITCGI